VVKARQQQYLKWVKDIICLMTLLCLVHLTVILISDGLQVDRPLELLVEALQQAHNTVSKH
jgi:hypothetical protein